MISVVRWMRISSFLFALLVAFLVAGRTAAQDITGALQGRVVSPEGTPEPEVHVTVSGPYLQGTRETLTDRDGFFQFLVLPPGRYALKVTRVGLRPVEVRDIVVELGRTTAVGRLTVETQPIEMKPVEVSAQALSLDPVHTTAGGTLNARDYAALPVERDYKSLIVVLPHTTDSHRGDPVNVGGATGLENMYYIDGVNVTDTRMADRATSLPYDFVRAVDVKTGGYEAQYGRALGAIVNAVTYSGTNDFEVSVFGFTQPGGLVADPRTAPAVAEGGAVNYDYGMRVSGPVLRDRLWYSAAVNPRLDRVEKEVGGFGNYTDKTSAVRFASKLTWRANAGTNLELSVFGDPTVQDLVSPAQSWVTTVLNPDALLYRVETGGVTTSLRGTVAPNSWLLLQASVAQQQDRYSLEGATARARVEPIYYDYYDGACGGGSGMTTKEDRDRTSLSLRGMLLMPRHTVVAGVEYEEAVETIRATGEWIARLDSAMFATDLRAVEGKLRNRSPVGYLQDAWRATDRLTLNAGLRWSGQFLIGASGRTGQGIADEWQPRIGFSWQLGRAVNQRLFGSYGRFYETLPLNMAVGWFVDFTELQSSYSSDPRVPGAVPDQTVDMSTKEADMSGRNPGLQAENSDEFTFGYERLLGARSKLTVRGVRRQLRSSYQYGIDSLGKWVLGTPGKGDFSFLPPPKREYTALEVATEGTWRALQYRASYVLSRNWGNYPGLYDSDFGGSNPGGISTFFMPHQARNSTGYLPNDHTHVLKLSAAWATRAGLSTGAILSFETGSPINEFGEGPWGFAVPTFLVQRGTAGRTPSLWNLDLRLAYEVPVVRRTKTRAQLDVLHVGNPRGTTRVNEFHSGDPVTPDPNYKQPVAYQLPMAARLGVQLSF